MTPNTAKQLVKVENGSTFEQLQTQAALLVKSGFLPKTVDTPEKALTIMLTGKELGLGPMESIRSINVVNGRPCMSAQLLLALCHRTKEVEQAFTEKTTDAEVVFVLKRRGSPAFRSVFTRAEADQAKFSQSFNRDKNAWQTKDNWVKQPATMLLWRAISKAARIVFPDAICGIYTPDEAEDIITEIEQVQATAKAALAIATEVKKEELATSVEAAAGTVHHIGAELDLLTKVSNSYIQDAKFAGIYGDKTIGEIYEEKTPAGKPKGKQFLEVVMAKSMNPEDRANIEKFFELVDGAEPGTNG